MGVTHEGITYIIRPIVVVAVPTLCKIAHDYPDVDVAHTSETKRYDVYVIRDAASGTDFDTLLVQAEGKSAAGQHLYVYIYVDTVLRITLDWNNETSLTVHTGTYDISGWADGKHHIEIKDKVSGGTGHLEFIEVWVKKS